MNANIKEIGHLAFKLKNAPVFEDWYENTLGLKVGFTMKKNDQDYIIYYQLRRGQFIEIFPEWNDGSRWPEYDGNNREEDYSYQYATIGDGEGKLMVDPENNKWFVNEGEKYISKVTYHVNDLKKSVDFYRNIFELDVKECDDKKAYVTINDYQVIELIEHPYPKNNSTHAKGQCHYALIVNDIASFAKDMEAKGIQLWHGAKTYKKPYTEPYVPVKHSENTYNFYMQDPDDNEIEVMCYSEESFQVKYAVY
ncbi:MAG: VOC family protein [Solobacterium sp.]|nr:VOC family protein [Solobacterium sp.]